MRLSVRVDDSALFEAVDALLPPDWQACDDGEVAARFAIGRVGDGYDVMQDETPIAHDARLPVALQVLDSQMRLVIATHAPNVAFVHAGAVAVGGRAIVLPGRSFAGKTTLVAELIRRGATYLSDEYAVLDERGRVHPYPKALSIRALGDATRSRGSTETQAAELGAATASDAVPLGFIVAASYRPGARWAPETRSQAQGALVLLSNAFAARDDPGRVLRIVRRAATGAVVLEGDRGEATIVADDLIRRAAGVH